ncbi:AAA family ATPase [Streptomyces sp. NPDC007808]|uniref:AAA family ATPase n=1 Tax=Streptomyces sp. NPDC007808 TaxID=3364779 RepID=UPI003675ABE2
MTSEPQAPARGPQWWIYRGVGVPHRGIEELPEAPAWRRFDGARRTSADHAALPEPPPEPADGATARRLGRTGQAAAAADDNEVHLVNLALHLRRPLLVTGKPGVGKSTLPYAVAHELQLGPVLKWPITSRSTLRDGLYSYDAIGRLHDAGIRSGTSVVEQRLNRRTAPDIGHYLRLGPLGTALLPWRYPRVLLIDEIDKGDIDLPNDLLNVFEEGEFEIPELARLGTGAQKVMTADPHRMATVTAGTVRCAQFPLVILTSNAEREFPSAFLRRCLRLEMSAASPKRLRALVEAHLREDGATPWAGMDEAMDELIEEFTRRQNEEGADLANDQLLSALLMAGRGLWPQNRRLVENVLLRPMNQG